MVAAVLFIYGLKGLTSPSTARRGNQLAATGMLIAVVATLYVAKLVTPVEMLSGLLAGGAIGTVIARRVPMTGMPEMVAALNGFGGAASVLVAFVEVFRFLDPVPASTLSLAPLSVGSAITIGLSVLIGSVTLSGSFIAFVKLSGRMSGNPASFPGMRLVTACLSVVVVAAIVFLAVAIDGYPGTWAPTLDALYVIAAASLALGVLLVIPIGGADMPVVVALLNSYSGLAAASTGFVLNNTALIISGALVGTSGLILTKIMCEGMNRSLINVLLGGFGGDAAEAEGAAVSTEGLSVTATTADDVAILLTYAEKVIVVPGYGMAVAQAQHQVRELGDLLQGEGVSVKYAIHPVAGRMPGHMNVLLAEANVSYDLLFEMDEINGEFESTDVVLVIGANDVVNPAARNNPSSPIYGMPILNVDQARNAIVFKRSMRPGYSGIENELFYADNTKMLFGDAKDSVAALVNEVKLAIA
jgi:NAD(P) transhydrogenase subunit beta